MLVSIPSLNNLSDLTSLFYASKPKTFIMDHSWPDSRVYHFVSVALIAIPGSLNNPFIMFCPKL